MIKKICAVFDLKSKVYFTPYPCVSIGESIRSFSDAVNDPQSGVLNKHPEDFLLFEIGSFDDVSGELVALIPPNRLALGSDFVLKVNGKVVPDMSQEVLRGS